MIRVLLQLVLIAVIYQMVKTVFRAARDAYRRPEDARTLPGEEMVLDPRCRTYVVKNRSIARRINGMPMHFCSADCADRYEQQHRT